MDHIFHAIKPSRVVRHYATRFSAAPTDLPLHITVSASVTMYINMMRWAYDVEMDEIPNWARLATIHITIPAHKSCEMAALGE